MRDTVWPALEAGKWVISDRFADSSRAFQGIAGNLGLDTVENIHRIVVGDFAPALVLILDIPESLALARARERGDTEDRFEKKGADYHARVRDAFLEIAASDTQQYVVVDADQDIDRVNQDIIEIINTRFSLNLQTARSER